MTRWCTNPGDVHAVFLQKQLDAGEVKIRQLSADLAAANQLLGNDLAEKNKDLRTKLQEAQLALDTVSNRLRLRRGVLLPSDWKESSCRRWHWTQDCGLLGVSRLALGLSG